MIPRSFSLLLGLALIAGCASDRYLPKNIFLRMQQAYATDSQTGGISRAIMEQQEERFARVRRAYEQGEIEGADSYFYSAAILVTSDLVSDLELAHEFGEQAASLGQPAGLAIAAQAIDLLAIKHGLPQPYGTQFRFEPVLGEWKLHNVDPRTTDAERIAMGVPTLAELEEILARRNASPMTRRLKERLQISSGMPR